ncbi:hypothetical protein [Bradyrhizobium sp. 2TAF24]
MGSVLRSEVRIGTTKRLALDIERSRAAVYPIAQPNLAGVGCFL